MILGRVLKGLQRDRRIFFFLGRKKGGNWVVFFWGVLVVFGLGLWWGFEKKKKKGSKKSRTAGLYLALSKGERGNPSGRILVLTLDKEVGVHLGTQAVARSTSPGV